MSRFGLLTTHQHSRPGKNHSSETLIWLNPLKGMQGYEPIQRGMQTAMPSLSHFGSAHDFESLLQLENILLNA